MKTESIAPFFATLKAANPYVAALQASKGLPFGPAAPATANVLKPAVMGVFQICLGPVAGQEA